MLENIADRPALLGFARQQARPFVTRSVHPAEADCALADGWEVAKRSKRSVRLRRGKSKPALLESRVWTMLYQMGFGRLSGPGGAILRSSSEGSLRTQLDVVALDEEIAIAIECKSYEQPKRDPAFRDKVARLALTRPSLAAAVRHQFPESKRHVGLVMFTWDLILAPNDAARADDEKVILLDERDLAYYEKLVAHLGPAARYQFLGDVFPHRPIGGLEIRVPALQAKMGTNTCYTFAVKPEYLLKIAFVSHRAKGKASDVNAYQRMISRSRLRKIRQFIANDGVFPTNIVVNIEKSRFARFEVGKQEGTSQGGRFGWLTLSPSYKSAWIIDGQHRLFAYSGQERASRSYLNVLAFDGLPASAQVSLFVEINHQQKSVKRSLLDELWAELHWDSADDEKRVRAIISKAVQALGMDKDSPLYDRILLADVKKSDTRCISLSSVLGALDRAGFFLGRQRKKGIAEYGPLWAGDNGATLQRTVTVLKAWFGEIARIAAEWWQLGASLGGGLAMNDGVTASVAVLRSVFDHLGGRIDLLHLSDNEVAHQVRPYACALGEHFARMTPEERAAFRALRGIQGQTAATRQCQQAIHAAIPEFLPEGLADWLERQKANNNEKARRIIERLERAVQRIVLEALRSEYGIEGDAWWFKGVPLGVRKKIDDRINETGGEAGTREQNFDLIHYREIAAKDWDLFKALLGRSEDGNSKEKQTAWINDVSRMRNVVMHPSRQEFLSFNQVSLLEKYAAWVDAKLTGREEPDASAEEEAD